MREAFSLFNVNINFLSIEWFHFHKIILKTCYQITKWFWMNDVQTNKRDEDVCSRKKKHHNEKRKLLKAKQVCTTWAVITMALNSRAIQLKEVKQIFWTNTPAVYLCCISAICLIIFLHSLLFCLNVNDRSSNDFSVLIWQLVHGTTLINGIYQPFRSFLLDEGSVILIAKECIDIKTRTPTLAFYDKEFQWKIFSWSPKAYFPPS